MGGVWGRDCRAWRPGGGRRGGSVGGAGRGCREQGGFHSVSALQPGIGLYSFSFLNVGSGLFNSENHVATWLSGTVPFHPLK